MAAQKISLALGGSKKPPPKTNGIKRTHAVALRDQDHEEEDTQHGKAQTVSHFDRSAGGAIDEKRVVTKKAPLVIEATKNRDWKEASQRNKRMRYAQAVEGERQDGGMERAVKEVEHRRPGYGLNILKKTEAEGESEDVVMEGSDDAEGVEQNGEGAHEKGDTTVEPQHHAPKTADEEAMEALLGNKKSSTLILPAMSEEEAFERDYKDAPDMASLADYDRVPVEEFGAAMLRGMGWKDGEGIGANKGKKAEQTKVPTRRPALLGIGAKEEAAVAQELGTWGKAAKGREIKVYNPVLLRDKRTGEMFTEEEAEQRKAREERERFEMEFEQKEARRREKEKRSEGDGDKRDRRRRETSEERRERKDRERRREREDSEEEYRRRKKEKERRRRDRDEDGDDRRRHDSRREGRKDHDRRR